MNLSANGACSDKPPPTRINLHSFTAIRPPPCRKIAEKSMAWMRRSTIKPQPLAASAFTAGLSGHRFFQKVSFLLRCKVAFNRLRAHSESKRVSRLPYRLAPGCGIFNPLPTHGKGVSL
jgi:hypothetical protein